MTKIERGEPERVEIFCHALSDEVREIVAFVKSRRGQLTGTLDDRQYEVPVTDIFYIESVDNKVFLYTKDKVYETKQKISTRSGSPRSILVSFVSMIQYSARMSGVPIPFR